jgi:hypothetical protein
VTIPPCDEPPVAVPEAPPLLLPPLGAPDVPPVPGAEPPVFGSSSLGVPTHDAASTEATTMEQKTILVLMRAVSTEGL